MRMWSRAATRAPATAHLKLPLTARRAFASARPTEQKIQALKWTIPLEFAQQMSLFWAKSHYCRRLSCVPAGSVVPDLVRFLAQAKDPASGSS